MKRPITTIALLSWIALAAPAFAKTHKDDYAVPCTKLWKAVKDTLRNSGKYGIVGVSDEEMTASYIIGGGLGGKRINSLVLNPKGSGCELQDQTAYSGLVNNDAGDLRKRVDASLVALDNPAATTGTDHPVRSIPRNAKVYVVPSDASQRFAHFIQHPPIGAGELHKAALQIVSTPADASYSLACNPVWQKKHDAAVNHLIGGYMPGWSTLEVRLLPSGNLVFYNERDTGGGSDKRRDDLAARICAVELSRLTR
jgi:hypothetical protein